MQERNVRKLFFLQQCLILLTLVKNLFVNILLPFLINLTQSMNVTYILLANKKKVLKENMKSA